MKERMLWITIISLSAFTLILISILINIKVTDGANPHPKALETISQPEKNVSEKDTQMVERLTKEMLDNFKEGQIRKLNQLNDINEQFTSNDFFENIYTDSFQKERWIGIFGLGKFFDKEWPQDIDPFDTETELDHVTGTIKRYEIADLQKDQNNNTITTYIRYDDGIQTNQKEWIEWRDIPGEGWKINAVSFSANIEYLETPISPKKEWK
jgi:hypothetical protein